MQNLYGEVVRQYLGYEMTKVEEEDEVSAWCLKDDSCPILEQHSDMSDLCYEILEISRGVGWHLGWSHRLMEAISLS